MRILANSVAIACLTIAALQLVDAEYLAAALLVAVAVGAYIARLAFPPSGSGH